MEYCLQEGRNMKVEILNHTHNPEQLLSEIGSISHASNPSESVLKTILRLKHYSVLEHATVTFKISDISRACSHQLVRHRIGVSILQESQRYVKQAMPDFITPSSILENTPTVEVMYNNQMDLAHKMYCSMLSQGIPPEDARFILPQSYATKLIMTFNYRSLLHFYEERACETAQWEINQLAEEMKILITPIAPLIAAEMKPRCQTMNVPCKNKRCKYAHSGCV